MRCEDCSHAEMCKWIDELEGRGCDFFDGEPCTDAVSREAVKDLIKSGVSTDTSDDVVEVCKWIDALPSVTQKSGKWIFVDKAKEHAHCSECDYGNVDVFDGRPHNYCPNCGARMVEPQESEDKK